MQLCLFDDRSWENLLPLTFARPSAGLRVGILTLAEKWEMELGSRPVYLTRRHLAGKFPGGEGGDRLMINGSLLPDPDLVRALGELEGDRAIRKGEVLLGARMKEKSSSGFIPDLWLEKASDYSGEVSRIDYPWKIFSLNGQEIEADFQRLTRERSSEALDASVAAIAPEAMFIEPGFKGRHFTLNAATGPIYLGRDSEIMEGSVIRGPFSLGEGAVVKMAARIYGPTTIGPHCKVGGEVNNSVFQANSNKAHDGFLGNAVIGEWCNIGADTNNSNLKNNYAGVRIWNYPAGAFIPTGLQFCGLFMGDHSKCGINTMFNTGTVVGVAANIFGSGFPRNFIPSFSWGGASGMTIHRLDKALETAALVMERRGQQLDDEDRKILQYIFEYTARFRKFT